MVRLKVLFLPKKPLIFCQKTNADVSKINWVLVLKGIHSETTYTCVIKFQISSFFQNFNKFLTGEVVVFLYPSIAK